MIRKANLFLLMTIVFTIMVNANSVFTQGDYRWRNDDGNIENATPRATSATSVETKAALLLKNGEIVSPYDGLPLYLNHEIDNNLFVVVYHRSHLGNMSAYPLIEFGGTYSWDFTTQPAFGVDAQKDLGGGVFGMYSGDTNHSGDINDADIIT